MKIQVVFKLPLKCYINPKNKLPRGFINRYNDVLLHV